MCGVDTSRVYWRGVTVLEETEIAPTYEIYLTGCSLRCRFCTVPRAIERPDEGEAITPEDLAAAVADPRHPSFRTVSFVGGDPSVNLPYLTALAPLLRARLPGVPLVFNTNLYWGPSVAAWARAHVDVVVGDVHFWATDCARAVAGAADYPAVAVRSAEAAAASGLRLLLRVLVLPGHVACCAAPTIAWARTLEGDVRVHVMTHYAPVGRARGHPTLGRALDPAEHAQVASLCAGLSAPPIGAAAGPAGEDPDVPVEIDGEGRLFFPFVTGSLLPALEGYRSVSPASCPPISNCSSARGTR